MFVYNYLLVQLPNVVFDTYWCFACFDAVVTRLDGSVPIKYGIRLNMDEKYKALKKELSRLTSIPPDQILFVEIMGPIVKVIPDSCYSFPCFISVCYGFFDGYCSWFCGSLCFKHTCQLSHILLVILNLFSWC